MPTPPRSPGRPKGKPNKATTEARELFTRLMDSLLPEVEGWIRAEAEGGEPGKAADLFFKLSEFCVPKLARHEVTGKNGGPVQFEAMTDEQLGERYRDLLAKGSATST